MFPGLHASELEVLHFYIAVRGIWEASPVALQDVSLVNQQINSIYGGTQASHNQSRPPPLAVRLISYPKTRILSYLSQSGHMNLVSACEES